MSMDLWQQCVELLRDELPAQQFNTWIRPLQIEAEGDELRIYAPNRFVLDWVNEKYLGRLLELLDERGNGQAPALSLLIGSKRSAASARPAPSQSVVLPSATVASPALATVMPTTAQMNVVSSVDEPSRASFDPMRGASGQLPPARTERTVQVEG
ncbi:MAG: DnaA N-terminal domain-containing protein, partial [Pseudomonas sp.]|nr:DnaA N-terminal domain-containing protein [Pseudomonas sp.]